uniref:Uncharacterized protein n=1 Tax=Thiothrix fructosivorans TaxID=111770 RepID=A0A8B0SIN9_9GAMM|nr:hypothetical protein J1836_000450 [Thiothrix fructosivorans]
MVHPVFSESIAIPKHAITPHPRVSPNSVKLVDAGMVAGIAGTCRKSYPQKANKKQTSGKPHTRKKYIVFLGYCCDFGVTGVTGVTGFFICYLSIA